MEQQLKIRFSILVEYVIFLFLGIVLLGFLIFKCYEDLEAHGSIVLFVILGILFLFPIPSIILSATYLYTDLTKQIFIDKEKKTLKVRTGKGELYITNEDIKKSYRIKSGRWGRYRIFSSYEYVLLVLKERKRVFITGLLAEPNEIISLLSLNCQEIEMRVPFLDIWLGGGVLKEEERNKKTQEYRELFKSFPNNKLQAIVRNHEDYTDIAREAAKQLLKERNL